MLAHRGSCFEFIESGFTAQFLGMTASSLPFTAQGPVGRVGAVFIFNAVFQYSFSQP